MKYSYYSFNYLSTYWQKGYAPSREGLPSFFAGKNICYKTSRSMNKSSLRVPALHVLFCFPSYPVHFEFTFHNKLDGLTMVRLAVCQGNGRCEWGQVRPQNWIRAHSASQRCGGFVKNGGYDELHWKRLQHRCLAHTDFSHLLWGCLSLPLSVIHPFSIVRKNYKNLAL